MTGGDADTRNCDDGLSQRGDIRRVEDSGMTGALVDKGGIQFDATLTSVRRA